MAVNQLPELLQDLRQLQADLGFNGPSKASEEIVRDLQGLSPAWTGRFRNSWFIQASDGRRVGGGGQAGIASAIGWATTFRSDGWAKVFWDSFLSLAILLLMLIKLLIWSHLSQPNRFVREKSEQPALETR